MLKKSIASALAFWTMAKGASTGQIQQASERPFTIGVVGVPASEEALLMRLAAEPGSAAPHPDINTLRPLLVHYPDPAAARHAGARVVIDADEAARRQGEAFRELLAQIVREQPDLRIALASRFGAFRPVVI